MNHIPGFLQRLASSDATGGPAGSARAALPSRFAPAQLGPEIAGIATSSMPAVSDRFVSDVTEQPIATQSRSNADALTPQRQQPPPSGTLPSVGSAPPVLRQSLSNLAVRETSADHSSVRDTNAASIPAVVVEVPERTEVTPKRTKLAIPDHSSVKATNAASIPVVVAEVAERTEAIPKLTKRTTLAIPAGLEIPSLAARRGSVSQVTAAASFNPGTGSGSVESQPEKVRTAADGFPESSRVEAGQSISRAEVTQKPIRSAIVEQHVAVPHPTETHVATANSQRRPLPSQNANPQRESIVLRASWSGASPSPLRSAAVEQHTAVTRSAERQPIVHVTIDRIDVRAPSVSPAGPTQRASRPRTQTGTSLSDYLRQRGGDRS